MADGAPPGAIACSIAQLGRGQYLASLLAGLASCAVIGVLLPELAQLRSAEESA